MFRRFQNYIQRVKNIHDNPFWVTSLSRTGRASALKTLWRGYAGYALLLMLPLGMFTNYAVEASGLTTDKDRMGLSIALAVAGVVQLLYLSTKAALSTAPSVVQARQQGTLLALALTRINSADFADGVALSEARLLLREFVVWVPAVGMVTWMAGQSLYSVFMLTAISALCILYFAYNGVYISATCKDTQEAGRKASVNTAASGSTKNSSKNARARPISRLRSQVASVVPAWARRRARVSVVGELMLASLRGGAARLVKG